ncbi:MAG TPA: UDP binding domain-containing protein [Candidatus Acidoferrum sp.]|jgi:UDPglucose 6-dehydrogenase|nr:UDP binding domain-containing protein [Candidatus Acidoferrum sp.]
MSEATYWRDLYDAAAEADAILLLTEWEQFRHVDWRRLAGRECLIIDGRNMLSREEVVCHGFE